MRTAVAWVATALLLVAGGCDPFNTQFDDVEAAAAYSAAEREAIPRDAKRLRVMTWNVKFGGGRVDFFFDCHGDASVMEEGVVLDHLEGLAAKIRQVDPDVLFLQEVDVLSRRSAYVDQVQWLLDHTDLSYGAYASQWRADFVPQSGIGKVDSGNAILSRWPLADAERIALPLIGEQDALTQYFWLRRNMLRARLDIPDNPDVWVIGTHAAAFSTDGTKRQHIDRFDEALHELSTGGARVIGAGDLNAVPPGSVQLEGFDDEACANNDFDAANTYSEETEWLDGLYTRFTPAIPLDVYQSDNAPHFSHTTDKDGFWNRKLDYIFTTGDVVEGSGLVHQSKAAGGVDTMALSDHAPVTCLVEVAP